MHDLPPPPPDELNAACALRARVYQDPGHVAPQREVEVAPKLDGPDERLRSAAPRPPPHRVLVEGETSLLLPVYVHYVVAHLLAGLEERYTQRRVVRGVLHRQVSSFDFGKFLVSFSY